MIPVVPAAEPDHFDANVRQRGLRALAEMIGETDLPPRPGRRRAQIASTREAIKSGDFADYWCDALDDLRTAYSRTCAYLGLYLGERGGTVDHFIPKSKDWRQVYEWSNYRLSDSIVNARKGSEIIALDPFKIKDGWFALEFIAFQVVVGPTAEGEIKSQVESTIQVLGLNQPDFVRQREKYYQDYAGGHISRAYLEKHAPFVFREMLRQAQFGNSTVSKGDPNND